MSERVFMTEKPKKVMVVVAHQDDETYAAGTLVKAAKAGHEIYMVAVTNGDLGTREKSSRDVVKKRAKEFQASALLLGATGTTSLNISEAHFSIQRVERELTAVTREINPDVIFTHHHNDYHPRHQAVRNAEVIAAFNAPATPYKARRGRLSRLPWGQVPAINDKEIAFYEMDSQGLKHSRSRHTGYDEDNIVTPGLIVNITPEEIEIKQKVFELYQSQNSLRIGNKMSYVDQIKLEASVRGEQAGFSFGEGYTQISHGGELFTTRNMLNEMFPGEVYVVGENKFNPKIIQGGRSG